MVHKKTPKFIDLPVETLDHIKSRVASCSLLEEDKKVILSIVVTYSWLLRQLQSTKFTLHRLKKMFGFSTEKLAKTNSKNTKASSEDDPSKVGTSANQILSLDELQAITKEPSEKK